MDELGLLRGLVEAYSPSGQEARAVRRFLELSRSLGLEAHADAAGNGIARIGAGHPGIVFLGHIDTVVGELPIRLDGDRLYGRGTCDAKGALAAALLAASRHDGPGEITVVAAVGEERDSRGTRALLPHHRPDFLLVGEPSHWDGITIGYKGNLSLVLTFEGTRSHLSAPTRTTVEASLAFVERLRAFCDAHRGRTKFASLAMKVHSTNTVRSGGRERVRVGVNLRLPPGLPAEQILEFIEGAADAPHVREVGRSPAVEVDPRNEVVRALVAGIRRQGGRPTLLRKHGTSDMNLAAPAWECPAAAYGPGDSHLDHTDEEHLGIEELTRSIEVLDHAFSVLARQRSKEARTESAAATLT